MGIAARLWSERTVLGPLALAAFVTYGYFVSPPAWNQNSRFALTRALVERGSATIDDAHATTGDKSYRDGHFYSDKAPGTSLLAVPGYAVVHKLSQLTGGEPPGFEVLSTKPAELAAGVRVDPEDMRPGDRLVYNQAFRVGLYLCRLLTTSLIAALGLVALYLLGLRQTAGDRRAALWVTATYGVATPALAYSSVFYGHQLCADFLLIALALIVLHRPERERASATWWPAVAAGASLGWAVLCEYPAAIPVVMLTGFALWYRGLRFTLQLILGGLPWAGLLALYHLAAFGGPLKTGYDFVYLPEFAEGMRVRYGIHAPDLSVTHAILFGRYRGLLYLSPVLLLALWGLVMQLRRALPPALAFFTNDKDIEKDIERAYPRRALAALALALVSYYLLLNSGYYMWDGGAALGPRHCVPMLPFLALGLAPALRAVPRTYWVLAAISALQITVATAAAPEAPRFGDPLYGFAWPRLLSGAISNYGGATNLGRLLGLPGPLSLAPLLALWAWAGLQLHAATRPEPTPTLDASADAT